MSFLNKINGHDTLVFMCFLIISSALWLLNAINERFETDIVVDVVVTNLPEGVELENQDDLTIEVFVRDKGSELFDYIFGNAPKVSVDYKDLTDNGNGSLTMHFTALENRVSNALKPSSTFLHFKDDYLSLQVKRERVTLPVKLNYDVETGKHYELVDVQTSVKDITVVAPSSRVKEWEFVELPEFVIKGLDKDTSFTFPLPREKYLSYEPSVIDVHLTVAPYVSRNVKRRVNIVNRLFDLNLGDYYDIPDSVTVSYLAPASVADRITEEDLRVELDFVELTGGKGDTVHFRLASCPFSIEKDEVTITPGAVCRKEYPQQWGGLLKQIANGKLY